MDTLLLLDATQMRALQGDKSATPERKESFARLQQRVLESNEENMHLDFREFGYDWTDVQWVIDLGFRISRNSACLWWEVSWKALDQQ